jgi:CheY-like chemotaxis protein
MTMVTLMDIQMPEMNGLDALIAIRTGFSDAVHGLPISQIGLIASLIRGHRVPSTRTSETPWPVKDPCRGS